MSVTLHGTGASKGVAIGTAYILVRGNLEVAEYTIAETQLEEEVIRFETALELARQQLRRIRDQIPLIYRTRKTGQLGKDINEIASFIDPHLMMLDDTMLTKVPAELIYRHQYNAEWALKIQRDRLVKVFEAIEDPYLRTRKEDIDQVINRVQYNLINQQSLIQESNDSLAPLAGKVILADELAPADTVLMQYQGIAAFVTEQGGMTSHTAILARSLGIPAIVGVRHLLDYLRAEDQVIVDGHRGVLLVEPDERAIDHFRALQQQHRLRREALHHLKDLPVQTQDGTAITLYANIELLDDIASIQRAGALGIGLFRTEFLFMNRSSAPSEEEHLRVYRNILDQMNGGPVTIRTLDLGADKQVDGKRHQDQSTATNPALGLRAIRLCLKDDGLFRPQVRAILRASAFGPVRMLIPMLSGMQELRQVMRLLREIRSDLDQRNIAYNPNMPIGAMVEVPAMVICLDMFLPYVQFVSIGTNDLIQYTLAIDRCDNEVNYLYEPLHPAVLRLIHRTLQESARFNVPVSMCGEMAGDPRYVKLLLGLGLRSFSVNAESYLEVKEMITTTRLHGLEKLAVQTLNLPTIQDMAEVLAQLQQY